MLRIENLIKLISISVSELFSHKRKIKLRGIWNKKLLNNKMNRKFQKTFKQRKEEKPLQFLLW